MGSFGVSLKQQRARNFIQHMAHIHDSATRCNARSASHRQARRYGGRKCQNKVDGMRILYNQICKNICILSTATRELLLCENGSSFLSDPLLAGLFCVTSSSGGRSAMAIALWLRSIGLPCAGRRLCFTPTQIRAQCVLQPFGLDTLFVLCIFRQYHSPLWALARRGRCQMQCIDASRLTLGPSLRIGPHLRYCCCSSVVERVIGNDEVGSSILPSSTRYFPPLISYT